MKKILVFLIFSIVGFCANAQTLDGKRYRGYVDFIVSPGNDGVYHDINTLGFGGMTSHGYQFNQHIFLGAGMGVQYYRFDNFTSGTAVPVFGNFRANFTKTRVSPYFDAKIGYSVVDVKGVFISPSFGIRFGMKNNVGINLQVGYSLQGYKYSGYYYIPEQAYVHSVNISLGVDW